MSNASVKGESEIRWVIHTPLGFYRGYDQSIRSVTFTQDVKYAQTFGLEKHAVGYVASTPLVGIPTTVMPQIGAQDVQYMGVAARIHHDAINGLNDRIGG